MLGHAQRPLGGAAETQWDRDRGADALCIGGALGGAMGAPACAYWWHGHGAAMAGAATGEGRQEQAEGRAVGRASAHECVVRVTFELKCVWPEDDVCTT